jgi:hypothetical protein
LKKRTDGVSKKISTVAMSLLYASYFLDNLEKMCGLQR